MNEKEREIVYQVITLLESLVESIESETDRRRMNYCIADLSGLTEEEDVGDEQKLEGNAGRMSATLLEIEREIDHELRKTYEASSRVNKLRKSLGKLRGSIKRMKALGKQ